MKVLILAQAPSAHEERFARALADGGVAVVVSRAQGAPDITRAVARETPDVVQVGPIPLATEAAQAVPHGLPLVLVSYGWDAFAAEEEGWEAAAPLLSRADAAMCDCGFIENALRRRLRTGVPIARFPWGVDLDAFRPEGPCVDLRRPRRWPAGSTVLLGTRRLEPLYDPLTLVRALAEGALPDDPRLLLLGEGSLRDEVVATARSLGIEDRVDVAPPVPEAALPEIMRSADVWVNAARSDGACISLLQALACDVPVVTPDLPCPREWVDDDVGAMFTAGDPAAAASAMRRVIEECDRFAGPCRRRAVERADWSRHAETYRRLVAHVRATSVAR